MPDPIFNLCIPTDYLQMISLVAGALVASSSVPAVVDSLRRPVVDGWFQIARNGAATLGNWAWTAFGLQTGHVAIAIFCGLSGVLLMALTILQITRMIRRTPHADH